MPGLLLIPVGASLWSYRSLKVPPTLREWHRYSAHAHCSLHTPTKRVLRYFFLYGQACLQTRSVSRVYIRLLVTKELCYNQKQRQWLCVWRRYR